MENASNALLMAGGILIALLIIGALVMMGANLQSYQNNNDNLTKSSQIAEFNNQFEPYHKDNLTLMELKSVYNKIESNNVQHPEYKIEHNIEFLLRSVMPDDDGDVEKFLEMGNGFKDIEDAKKQNLKFKCTNIEYLNLEGRISKISFDIK